MTTAPGAERRKITTLTLADKKKQGEPITIITGYDYPAALALDRAGVGA